MKMTRRAANGVGVLACALLLAYAYYLQYGTGLEPCPLCIFQRMVFFGLGGVFLVAALHNPARLGARIYGALLALTGLTGIGLAIRHLYIQSLPAGSVPTCGATLDYMLDVFPLTHVIRKVLTGSGECGKIDWTFLGLSMPAWTLVAFIALTLWAIFFNWRKFRQPA